MSVCAMYVYMRILNVRILYTYTLNMYKGKCVLMWFAEQNWLVELWGHKDHLVSELPKIISVS